MNKKTKDKEMLDVISKLSSKDSVMVGIDGGVNTGFCLMVNRKIAAVTTTDFFGALFFVSEIENKKTTLVVVVEDPTQIKPVFPKRSASKSTDMKIAQNVGGVKRESELLIKAFKIADVRVMALKPSNTKKSREQVKRLTGYDKPSNDHERDAIMLVYGL